MTQVERKSWTRETIYREVETDPEMQEWINPVPPFLTRTLLDKLTDYYSASVTEQELEPLMTINAGFTLLSPTSAGKNSPGRCPHRRSPLLGVRNLGSSSPVGTPGRNSEG